MHYYGATQLTFQKNADVDGAQIKKNPRARLSEEETKENMLALNEEKTIWNCMPCCKKSETLDIDIVDLDGANDSNNRSTILADMNRSGMLSTS